jgi:apolipoprotein N-acyltransferase
MIKKTLFYLPAALSGAAMVLIFPRAGMDYLAWVCLVPLIVSILCRTQHHVMMQGIVAGTIYHIGLVYWVVVSMNTYGGVPQPLAVVLLAILSFFLSLFVALPLWSSTFIWKRTGIRLTLTLPICWVASEYIKSWFLTGFPWELLGYSQFQNLRLIQIADITGIYGVSFVLLGINCAIATIVHALIVRRRFAILEPCCALVLMAACLFYGHTRMQEFHDPVGPRLTALLIQPNIPQDLKWDPEYLNETMQRLFHLSTTQAPDETDLIIWPESATPFFFQSDEGYKENVFRTLRHSGSWLLFGSPSYTTSGTEPSFFNSAFLLRPDGSEAGKYDKLHLVPWGEYVPLQRLFPFINRLVTGIGDFSTGAGMKLLPFKNTALATLICYEIIFPNLTRQFVRMGGHYIINITNDAWFGNTCAPYQLLSMAVLRAVENKRFLVRAANTGISAVIAPTGKILAQTELFTEAALPATITALDQLTLYSRIGDIFAGICLLATTILLIAARRSKPRSAAP